MKEENGWEGEGGPKEGEKRSPILEKGRGKG
jgi:hypothetical protein